jgi:hypothetical protein
MLDIEGMLAIIFFFTSLSIVLGSWIFTRHRERMGMIDKGMKSEDIKAFYQTGLRNPSPLSSLKWGILAMSAGVAILAGMALHAWYGASEGVFPALILLFAGIGLIAFYALARNRPVE